MNKHSIVNINQETLNYILVSKRLFQVITSTLSTIMNFNNYNVINKLSVLDESTQFNLVKLNTFKLYKSLLQYKNDGMNRIYNKVLVILEIQESAEIISSVQDYPSNVQFDVSFKITNDQDCNFYLNAIQNYSKPKRVKLLDIEMYGIDAERRIQVLDSLLRFTSKEIIYNPNYGSDRIEDDRWEHADFSVLFQQSHLQDICPSLDYFEPKDLLSINCNSTRLKKLSFHMNFNHMVKIINGGNDELKINFRYPDSLQKDWNDMINVLMNLKSLRYVSLYNYCLLHNQFNVKFAPSESSCLTQGFKSLLSSPSCTITTLVLSSFNLIDDLFLEGLAANKSILTLVIKNIDWTPLIEKVLPINKTIRNLVCFNSYLKINGSDLFSQFIGMMKREYRVGNIIDYYSVTFYKYDITKIELLNIIDQIKSNSFSIKEYNIGANSNKWHFKSKALLSNGSILNIVN